jgi:two-component system, chemotaxis family, sensor kinase CheA
MELSQYGELFLAESREHITSMNHLLLLLEADATAREPVEGLFRAVHTIKGMSATMGYRAVADLAHELEDLLDAVRQGARAADAAVLDLLFAATDGLEIAVEHAVSGREHDYDAMPLLERLRAAQRTGVQPPDAVVPTNAAPPAADLAGGRRVDVVVDPGTPLPSVRAFLLLRRARELGEVAAIDPPEAQHQSETFDGVFSFLLASDLDAAEIERELTAVGEIASVGVGPDVATAAPAAGTAVSAPSVDAPRDAVGTARGRQMRVDPNRLDAMMNQAGELVILRDRLRRIVGEVRNAELGEVVDQTSRLIDELQNEIMRVRLVPVAQVFDRFPRLVRDSAQALGKQVRFVVEGKELEFDRSLLDEMSDPLLHLLRNSIDHGVESPEERVQAGKPATATVQLVATRERSRAVLRVTDDGRGIQRARVLEKAVAQGLADAAVAPTLTDEEVFRLLMRPGFSTATQVTDVSGRGVGLDVVANRVRTVGGTLEIASVPGQGTAFTLRLPLTLAIVQALLVRIGDDRYAIPIAHVAETTELEAGTIERLGARRVLPLRDEVLPVLSAREMLACPPAPAERLASLVVLEIGDQHLALEVDALLGQQEVVVKQFDATSDTLRVFSGATILSDGQPALILDVGAVPRLMDRDVVTARAR